MNKEFRFSLRHPDGRFYTIANRTIALTDVDTFVTDPVDWNQIDIRVKRHTRFYGVQRVVAIPVKFPKMGGKILRSLYLTKGVEAPCVFVAERKRQGREDYEVFYSGPVDFSQTICNDFVTQVSILDNGLENLLQVKGDTDFGVLLRPDDTLRLKADGVKLRNRSTFSAISVMQAASVAARQYSPTMTHTSSEAPYLQDLTLSRNLDTNLPAALSDSNFVYKASYPGTVKVSYKGTVNGVLATPALTDNIFSVVAALKSGGVITLVDIYNGTNYSNLVTSFTERVPFTAKEVAVRAGDTIALIIGVKPFGGTGSGRWYFDSTDGEFQIEYFLRQPETQVPCYRQVQVWDRLIKGVCGTQYGITSNYLNSTTPGYADLAPFNIVMTSGDGIRGLSEDPEIGIPPKLKTTINKMFKDGNSREMIGLGTEGNNVRIERMPFFFDDTKEIIPGGLGLIKDLKISVATDYIFNLLKVGYQYRENDTLNGKDDGHTTAVWSTNGTRVKNELDLVSDFIASMYAWEFVRGNLDGKTTTDSDKDNDVFLAEISGAVDSSGRHYLARRQNEPGSSVGGLIAAETAFNLSLLPKRNLLRNAARIAAGLHLDDTELKFQTLEQNTKISSKLSGMGLVMEKLNEYIRNFGAPPFLPIYLEFTSPVPRDFLPRSAANPYGRISAETIRNGQRVPFAGFIHEAIVKPGTREATNWQLLCSPSTALDRLV